MAVGDLELGDFVLRQLSSFLIGAGASFLASGVCGLGVRIGKEMVVVYCRCRVA